MSLIAALGIELPVIQAPLAGVQDSKLALAVCAAGDLGSLPAAMLSLPAAQATFTRCSTTPSQLIVLARS